MTYKEFLKMNPYHGMPVTCEIEGKHIDDAKLSRNKDGWWYLCQNEFYGFSITDLFGYESGKLIFWGDQGDDEKMLKIVTNLKPKNMEQSKSTHPLANIKAGDVLYDGEVYCKALSDVLCPELGELATVLVSYPGKKDSRELKVSSRHSTLYELQEDGFKIHSEEQTTLTKEEAKAKLKELTGIDAEKELNQKRTVEDILSELSEEDKQIIKQSLT